MIKRLLLSITALLSAICSFSQTNIFELKYDLEKASILTSPFHYSKYSYTVIKEKNKIHRFILNREDSTANYKAEDSKNSPLYYSKSIKLIGSLTTENESLNALFDTKDEIVFFEKADLSKNTYTKDGEIKFPKEQFIGITQQGNTFIIVGHERKSKSLKFYYKKEGQPVRLKEIDFSFIEPKNGSHSIHIFLDDASIIDVNTIFDPALLTKEIKLYFTENKIIATCNQQYAFTQLAEIDTTLGKAKVKKFNFEPRFFYTDIPDAPKSNAFFANGYLFTGAAYAKNLVISVIDPVSEAILKRYEADREDDIPFKNTPILQEGGISIFSAAKKKELTSRQFVRKINEAELFISAKDEGAEEIELMIGSYREIASSGGSPGMFMPMGVPGMGGATVSFYVSFTPGFSTSWSKTTYMKSLLHRNTFNHISRPLPEPIQEKRELYEKELSDENIRCEFRTHDKEYLFLYDYDTKKFRTIEFVK